MVQHLELRFVGIAEDTAAVAAVPGRVAGTVAGTVVDRADRNVLGKTDTSGIGKAEADNSVVVAIDRPAGIDGLDMIGKQVEAGNTAVDSILANNLVGTPPFRGCSPCDFQ